MKKMILVVGGALAGLASAAFVTAGSASAAPPMGPGPVQLDPHRLVALGVAQQLLDETPMLPGATSAPSSPSDSLNGPPSSPNSPNLIDDSGWWTTATGDVQSAETYLEQHAPSGLTFSGTSTSSSPDVETTTVQYSADGTKAYQNPQLLVTLVANGDGVAVRSDAQLVWLPSRPADAWVPVFSATGIEVSVLAPGSDQPVVDTTLRGPEAAAIARAVNKQPTAAPGVFACPLFIGDVDTLHVGSMTVVSNTGGCGYITISRDGTQLAQLTGGGAVNTTIRKILGLNGTSTAPAAPGQRSS